jgi:hypothetical protein
MNDKTLSRYTTITVMLVAAFAAVVSYTHIRDLAMTNGYDWFTASILPLSVDGLIVGTSFMLVSASRAVLSATVARFGLWLGIIGTIAANVAYGLPHGFVGSTVSAWPAVAFIVAVEAWMQLKKNTMKTVAVASPTRRRVTVPKSEKTSKVTRETQRSGATGVRKGKRGVKPTAQIIGENEGIPVFDGTPSANQVATAIRCGHAKSVQLRQIMIDDNVDLHAALNIRNTRKENAYVEA